MKGMIFGFVNIFIGGSFECVVVFVLGIMLYIMVLIIL